MSAEPIPHEMLLRHAGFLRRLARDLIGDPAAAEDAVQEVWLRALEKPPRHGSNVRGWLRVVMTNLVRSKARGESRREARERDRALDPAGEIASTSPGDEATLRSVTEAVLALEEPLRTTVLQHYFQGLTAAEIATRDNLPVSTVKSRLQRALEILRTRMKRTNGDGWQASLLALTVPSKIGKGVILMSLKTKLAIGCAAILVAVVAYRGFEGHPSIPSAPLASESSTALAHSPEIPTPAKPPLEVADSGADSSARSVAPTAPATTQVSQLFFGNLLDPEGKPIRGVRMVSVTITDATGRRRTCDAKNDGAFAFNSLPPGRYWTLASAEGYRPLEDVVDLEAGHGQVQRDFTLHPATVLKIRALTPDGRALAEVLGKEPYSKASYVLQPAVTKVAPGEWIHDPHAGARFVDSGPQFEALGLGYLGLLVLDENPPAFVSLLNSERVLQTKPVAPGDLEVDFVISPDEMLATASRIRLQVVDAETRAPVGGARVRIAVVGRMLMSIADAHGVVDLDGGQPAEYTFSISATGYADASLRYLATPGVNDLGQVALDKAVAVELSVVGPDGQPRAGTFVLGVLDPATRTLEMNARSRFGASATGVLPLPGLARKVYVLRSSLNDGWSENGDLVGRLASGNVVLDLRSGVAPVNPVVHLVPATPLSLSVPKGPQKGLGFRVLDDQGLAAAEGSFFSEAPYPLALPPGAYRVLLLDADKRVLSELPLTLDAKPRSVELSR